MKHSNIIRSGPALLFAVCSLVFGIASTAAVPTVSSRVLAPVNGNDTVTLPGNTYRSATPAADQGLVSGEQQIGPMFIVLRRSPAQESALAAFNARQLDAASSDYHHWLQPEEFGLLYGPNDADISAVTGWLNAAGLQIHHVSEGRIAIEFYGTAAQVQDAFGVEMHRYLVNGASAIANDRDPQIPRALSPVVAGVSGLNTFPVNGAMPQDTRAAASAQGDALVSSPPLKSPGPSPDLSVTHDGLSLAYMTPFDFATIYNSLPLWRASKPILGTGVTIAIVGDNDVKLADITTFQSTFGLPQRAPTLRLVGSDPAGSSKTSTVALEMASAAAPGASLMLVVPEGGFTLSSVLSALEYTVDRNLAPIVVFPYEECERSLGSSSNLQINSAWQLGETAGMSIVVAAGNLGAAACNLSGGIDSAGGLDVNGFASSPFVTAVGGTDFAWNWSNNFAPYWNAPGTSIQYESAKGYIPEVPWNATCTNYILLEEQGYLRPFEDPVPTNEDLCALNYYNSYVKPLTHSIAGGGGASNCIALDSSGNCKAGSGSFYAKPAWQKGTGVPADGRRDVPDVSLFASGGWMDYQQAGFEVPPPTPIIPSTEILTCYSGGKPSHVCAYETYADVAYQTSAGTTASAAYWAGILALVVQKQGGERQGLVNPTLYNLFNEENLAKCNTSVVAAGNSCVFYDVSAPVTNGVACLPGSTAECHVSDGIKSVGILEGYTAGVGYDQTTGIGSVNITNLVNKWPSK
jgi:subtilase family serine protease